MVCDFDNVSKALVPNRWGLKCSGFMDMLVNTDMSQIDLLYMEGWNVYNQVHPCLNGFELAQEFALNSCVTLFGIESRHNGARHSCDRQLR